LKPLAQEWFTATELAALTLPGIATTAANVLAMAEREGWRRPEWVGKRWRRRVGRGGGIEYHWSLLAPDARLAWSVTHSVIDAEAEQLAAADAKGATETRWDAFFALPEGRRVEAIRRLQALD
jgi:putative transposase